MKRNLKKKSANKRYKRTEHRKSARKPKLRKQRKPSSTPFDDVFRTLITKRSEMLISVVNEMFSLDLPADIPISLKNDIHLLSGQRLETDSLFQIGDHLFHIECQSNIDTTISIRIIEYDFIAALESSHISDDGYYHIHFPNSGLLLLRHSKSTPDTDKIILHLR